MLHLMLGLLVSATAGQNQPLTAAEPIVVPGPAGKFDFMNVDVKDRLVFACHPGTSSFAVVNLKTETVRSVDLGVEVNGIDADSRGQMVYASGPGKTLEQVNMKTWKRANTLKLDGPGDSVIFDPRQRTVYVDNDDGTSLWFVNPKAMSIVGTAAIKEAPEVMVLDSSRGKIFQNIKTANCVQVVDIATRKVVAEYPLGELTGPHGLAEDSALGLLFSVGKNGKLTILNTDTGAIQQTVDVTKGSDQIAYDAKLKRLYIPGSAGMQVLQVSGSKANIIGTAPLPTGCHSVTVDSATHNVWVAYTQGSKSLVMKYTAH